jgi:acetoin utilization deacetylase AcuC-like enzyme
MALGLVHDPVFQEHDPGHYHPESPRRLAELEEALAAWPGLAGTQAIPLRPATEEELLRVHQKAHVHRIASTDGRAVGLDMDTQTSPRSYQVALLAAGATIDLCQAALEGEIAHGLSLVRPPGHHSTPVRAMGFCLFNNVALAAQHLLTAGGLERVLIVDWDVHHGNGTEDAFFEDPRVLYFSTHQWPFYPGTGPVNAVGRGPGKGFNINVPLGAGHDDGDYLRIFEDLLLPAARRFAPQFILVSAGFDAHREDPMGGMRVSSGGFAAMARVLMEVADEHCPGRVVGALEGGYNPAAQARAVIAVAEALMGDDSADAVRRAASTAQTPRGLTEALTMQCSHWPVSC